MDLYASGTIRTQYVDPVSFVPNGRCAFELDADKVAYLTNMRLLNLGCTSTPAHSYSAGLGALSLIKNMRLMDARTELGRLANPAQYLFFKNSNRTNSSNKSYDKFLKRNNLGQEISALNNKVSAVYGVGGDTAPLEADTDTAMLDLREIFPILNSVAVLPVSIFKNLRIEIEFEANPARQVIADTSVAVTVLRPILAVDFTDDAEAVKSTVETIMKQGIQWNEIENDNFTMPGQTITTDVEPRQEVQFQSLAFRGKYLERMLICKQLSNIGLEVATNVVQGYGGVASSQAWLQQNTQYRLNGKNVLPGFNGNVGDMERLAQLVDEWGVVTMVPGSNYYAWDNIGVVTEDVGLNGQQSWDCIRIGARVRELQIQLSRLNNWNTTANAKSATNAACVVNLYAEIKKMLEVSGAGYNVVYG